MRLGSFLRQISIIAAKEERRLRRRVKAAGCGEIYGPIVIENACTGRSGRKRGKSDAAKPQKGEFILAQRFSAGTAEQCKPSPGGDDPYALETRSPHYWISGSRSRRNSRGRRCGLWHWRAA